MPPATPRRCLATPRRCLALTRKGIRCSLTSSSTLKDELGRDVAEPLRRGGNHCAFHARPFCTRPAEEFTGAAIVLLLDLETSGLDVSRDLVVEIAATEAPSDPAALGASFATVVSGALDPGDAPAVHGIAAEEIARGPSFSEAWSRFVAFAEGLLDLSLQEEPEDSEDEGSPRPARPPSEPPQLLVLAHNGVRFDFALLLFECQRHSLSWSPLERWLFVDTLDVLRAFGAVGECLKLQCLAKIACGADGFRAHRALDDCVALRGVMECVAARLGSSCLSQLLRPFAVRLDSVASMAQVSVLCE